MENTLQTYWDKFFKYLVQVKKLGKW